MTSKSHTKTRSIPPIPVSSWNTKLLRDSKPGTLRSLRSSGGARLSKSLNMSFDKSRSGDFSHIENEYIRNLQQQVYYLELECEYLNEERNKLVTVPTSVSIEAERMIRRLKSMQLEVQAREKEILDKENTINIIQSQKDSTLNQLEEACKEFGAEKKELINQIVSLKKEVDLMRLDANKANTDYEALNVDLNRTVGNLRSSEVEKNVTQNKMHETMEELSNLRVLYDEKRVEGVKLQTEFTELEDRYFHSKVRDKENLDQQHKDEVKKLRYELREKEIQAEQDRALRLKISDDCAALVKENAAVSTQAIEYQKQLEMEKDFNRNDSHRKQVNIQELVTLKEETKHNKRELERYKELYELEQERHRTLLDKFTVEEENHARVRLQKSRLESELEEVGGMKTMGSVENVGLRRDNVILSDQVNELQGKLRKKDDDIYNLQTGLVELQQDYETLKSRYRLQSSFDKIKWEDFEQMADQMKTLSRSYTPIRNATLKNKEIDLDT